MSYLFNAFPVKFTGWSHQSIMETRCTRAAQLTVQVNQANSPVNVVRTLRIVQRRRELLALQSNAFQFIAQQGPTNFSRLDKNVSCFCLSPVTLQDEPREKAQGQP